MMGFPSGDDATESHFSIAVSALELGVLISVEDQDLDAFARNIAQLKPYYASVHAPSTRKCQIVGLNLMHLLVENNLSEFHTELEFLTAEEAATPHISFPITLERQLMVGSYDEVLGASAHVPDPLYKFFIENLLHTVRDSIADCLEVAYKTIKLKDAMLMMKFHNQDELNDYIQECQEDWVVQDDTLCFQPPEVGYKASDIPSEKLIAQSLSYATELERIV